MKKNYVLIDFENVQPKDLAILNGHDFGLIVFVGSGQSKVPFDFAEAMQRLGERASYLKIAGQGANALDYHIAFYVGELATREANPYFHFISRDTGFDPLITHLRARKISALRHTSLADIPFVQISNAKSPDEKIDAIVENLKSRRASRPRKVKTLTSTINGIFMKRLDEHELSSLVERLAAQGHIKMDGQTVSYGATISGH